MSQSHHVLPLKIYYAVFLVLLVFTGVTVWVAYFDLGRFNVLIALSIAVFKALLVVLYFMHARYSSRLTQVVIGAGFFWLALLIGMTMSDFLTREGPGGPEGPPAQSTMKH